MVPQFCLYSASHTHKDEHLSQNGLFSQCSKASITARPGILIIQSITAAQQSLLPVLLLMGHLLSCSILTPVHLTCTDDCYAQNDNKNLPFFFFFSFLLPFLLLMNGQDASETPSSHNSLMLDYRGLCPTSLVNWQFNSHSHPFEKARKKPVFVLI